ncbi:MAG TPA: endolytic transglycosylase MltG [Actinomycetota bacterium]|nr:endolytic transglycosylase MltG [Actinomycetota bacterium]
MRGGSHRADGSAARGTLLLGLVLLVLLIAGGAGAYWWATGASGSSEPVTVEIPQGASADVAGDLLAEADVIRSGLAFRVAAGIRGLGDDIRAGTYRMRTNMTLAEALAVITAGPPPPRDVEITIPEGFEVKEIAEAVADALRVDAGGFERLAESGRFELPPYLPQGTPTVEGFLFPETYGFPSRAGADEVILRLLAQFEVEAASLPWENARDLGLSAYEVVIVASMIEREAGIDADRPKISAVIHNRLDRGMPLQIDATIQYALPEDNRLLTVEDYEYPSPYNTYLHTDLPPTPIGSPGLASLRAALQPADADYLYFVVIDDSGRHAFAETYDQFLRLKEQAGL